MAVTNRFSVYEPRNGGSLKKKEEDGLQPVTPVYSTQSIAQPVKGQYMTNTMAMPTYTSPTAGKQYSYNTAAPTWQWDDSVRPGDWQFDQERPTYTNQYQDQINSMVNDILNRDKFSYDYNTDPLYQMYADAYTRNGQQAMKDTYAQVAARTGGLGSSYAGTQAQTDYNTYMKALNEKVPDLFKLAYSMEQDKILNMRNNLGMVQGLEDRDYNRYMDALGQWNTDRNLSYGQYTDEWNRYYNDRDFSYGQYQDDLGQWNLNRNWDYGLWQDNQDRKEAAAQAAYQQQVAAYNAKQKQVDAYNAQQQAAYEAALKQYQSQGGGSSKSTSVNSNGSITYNGKNFGNKDALFSYVAGLGSASKMQNAMKELLNNGIITQQEYNKFIGSRG